MKKNISIKILTILVIIAICLISFIGIYVKDKNQMKNVIPDYLLSMNLKGGRVVILTPDDSTNEVIYDSEGKVATDGKNEDGTLKEGYTKINEKVNPDEVLTNENYDVVKKVIEKRLEAFGLEDYTIRKNEQTGEIIIEIAESTDVDNIIYNLQYVGEFTIKDSQTDEVLINNDDIKSSNAVYSTSETGTRVYLNIEFNKAGKQKFEDITKKYIEKINEDGNIVTSKITINIDDEELLETYFDETITTGILQLSIGSASTDSETISNYIKQASQVAALISSGKMPIKYESNGNNYLSTAVDMQELTIIIYAIVAITCIALIYLCIKYKVNGVYLSVSYIGYIALLLIALRYTNVVVSLEAIAGFVVLLIANYMFTKYILKNNSNKKGIIKQTYIKYTFILLPLLLISIVFTFMKWIPIASIGMVMFWGLIIMFIYNYIVTNGLLSDK